MLKGKERSPNPLFCKQFMNKYDTKLKNLQKKRKNGFIHDNDVAICACVYDNDMVICVCAYPVVCVPSHCSVPFLI